jgi:hypothetical protein
VPEKLRLVEERKPVSSEEFGEVGFTESDRRLLITIAAKFDSFKEGTERRLELLERERANKEDLIRVERDLRQWLDKKADKAEVPTEDVRELRHIVGQLNRKVTWAYAFGAGGAFACSAVTYLLTMFFHKT